MDLHGGNVYELERKGIKDILDYSSNINPFGIPKEFEKAIIENIKSLEKYPDPYYTELKEKLGKSLGLSEKNIILGNGATEILFLYIKTLKVKKALIVAPSFAEYERALKSAEAEIDFFELKEEEDFELNVTEFKKYINEDRVDLVILCNPNNPTGNFINLDKMKEINDFLLEKGINLLVDEAFIEFIEEFDKKTALNLKSKNIFIVRAFTKFFAIPGLRLGYGVSYDEEFIQNMDKFKEPWSVNNFANICGQVALLCKEYIEKTNEWIKVEKKWMFEELSKNKNIKVYKTNSNFILVKLLDATSGEIREKMLEKGILVRDASNFKFLDNSFIRLAIKHRENNLIVISTLDKILEGRGK